MRQVSFRESTHPADHLHRVVRTKDLLDEGVTRAEIATRVGSVWRRLYPGVLLIPGGQEPTLAMRARAALLTVGQGAVVSHLTAARLDEIRGTDGLPGFWQ